jgi:hypothetical protein
LQVKETGISDLLFAETRTEKRNIDETYSAPLHGGFRKIIKKV